MIPMSLEATAFMSTVYPGITAEHLISYAERIAKEEADV